MVAAGLERHRRMPALRRGLAVGALPVRALGRSLRARVGASNRVDRAERLLAARRATAADTQAVLGSLKGGALKAGQLLSTIEAVFPQDPDGTWQAALVTLQQRNPALAFDRIEPVLVAGLGAQWRRCFLSFDEQAAAAASIGQVHRATWSDGRPVAVKVQYPHVAEDLLADIRILSAALRIASVLAPRVAMPPLVRELRTRLAEELDYQREAAHQRAFAEAYRGDEQVLIPEVVAVARNVLVTDWLDGTSLAEVARDGSQQVRDQIGTRYQRFFLQSPSRAGLLHTDPHPGNFRLMDDGRLGVLDFGSVMVTPGGLPPTFGALIGAMLVGDPQSVHERLVDQGLLRLGTRLDVIKLMDYLSPFTEPAHHEEFAFSRAWLHETFAKANDPRNPDFLVAMKLSLPPEQLFTQRVWLAVVGVLCGLNACVPVRSELIAWLPGFPSLR